MKNNQVYKECKNEIRKMLVQEKKLINQLKEIQKTKMEIILILTKDNEVINDRRFI